MRLRDYKFHILICLIVMIIVCIFTYFYFYTYNQQVEEVSEKNSLVDCESSLVELNNSILETSNAFITMAPNENITTVTELKADYLSNFHSGRNVCIAEASQMENTNEETYYLYILDDTNNRVGKTQLSNIMPKEPEKGYSVIFDWNDGVIAYSSNIHTPFYSFLLNNGNDITSSIKENTTEGNNFVDTIKIGGDHYLLAGISIGTNFYYARIITAERYQGGINTIAILTVLYIVILIIAVTTIFLTIFLAFKRNNRFMSISKRAAARSDAVIIRAKNDGTIFYCNHRIKSLVNELGVTKNLKDFIVDDGRRMEECLRLEEKVVTVFIAEGTNKYIEFTPFRYNNTYYLVGIDVTLDYQERKNLQSLSSKDPITGLPNYYQMVSEFPKVREKCLDLSMSFLMINVLEYQDLSKVFGQDVVNKILIEASNRIKNENITKYFYHVNESTFVVFLANSSKDQNAKNIDKITKILRATYSAKTNTLYVKFKYASLDVPANQVESLKLDDLYRKLDVTMQRVRSIVNRDVMKYDATIQNYVNYREQMQKDILIALEKEEFEMYYQPQYDVLEDRIAGFEALIRWNNPKYINVSPQEYIELSEQNGYIIDVGNFIIRSVFKKAKEFEQFGVHISVNVSPAQLFQAGFTSFLLEEFEKNNLKKGTIAIEITETFLMENFNFVIEKLNLLRSKGFSIHLDDFGTGYSSLQYLKDLPIDTIKTDKDFIKNITSDNYTRNIVKGIISMAKAINLKVISEGVETKDQADILKKIGTDYFQGYIISKAIPFNEALTMLKNGVDIYKKPKKGSK